MCVRKLQSALPDLIGRTIKHVVYCAHDDYHNQIFLYFTDGTYYELYGDSLCGIRHLGVGGLEVSRPQGFIPVNGRLEVLDANHSSFVERPPAATAATVASR
jgi:hypothetical protein